MVRFSEQTVLTALAETQKGEHKYPIHRFGPFVHGAEAGLLPGDARRDFRLACAGPLVTPELYLREDLC